VLNLYRIFYYKDAKKMPKKVIERLKEYGYIEYYSEIFAIINNANILINSYKEKQSIK